MRKSAYGYDVIIKQDEYASYVACVPTLPGCHTEGDTLNEAMHNIKEAIELYLEHTRFRLLEKV